MNTEQQLIQVGQLSYLDRVVSASALSCVDEELSNKLDKRTGGIVSGDVGVFGHSMEILSGNYFQSNAVTEGVKNFSYKNSFLQAESVFEAEGKHEDWGGAYTGSMGYCMISVMPASNQVQLCGDISGLAGNLGKKYSWAFASGADSKSLEIQSIDQQTRIVTFKSALPSEIAAAQTSSYEEMIDAFDRDDNAIYCPDDPTIGNIVIHNFYGNHAEGGSVKAIGKYAHAEGRATVADCRYSHAEGDRTFAGRMAAHAEGQVSKAFGYYSHAEGYGTEVTNAAKAAHAEGNTSKAVGEASHAEGRSTEADGNYAHTEGFYSKTAPGKIKGYAFNSTNISVDTANNFYSIALSKVNNNNYDPANFAFRVNDIITIIDDAEFLNYAKITAINKFTKSA